MQEEEEVDQGCSLVAAAGTGTTGTIKPQKEQREKKVEKTATISGYSPKKADIKKKQRKSKRGNREGGKREALLSRQLMSMSKSKSESESESGK